MEPSYHLQLQAFLAQKCNERQPALEPKAREGLYKKYFALRNLF